jgi:hypothetical protein
MPAQWPMEAGHSKRHPAGCPFAREGRTGPAGVPFVVRILSACQLWMVKSALRVAGVPICT